MGLVTPLTMTLRREGTRDVVDHPKLVVSVRAPNMKDVHAPLGLVPLVLGTGGDVGLVVDAQGVSRRHCELALGAGGVRIRDLDSKNGTVINGVRVLEAVVPEGVPVQLGTAQLVVRRVGPDVTVPLSATPSFGDAVGLSVAMRALFALLEKVAKSDEAVLLTGESGTGKELLARGLHAKSVRNEGPFVVVDCGALAANLVEAELFGHEKGAFTGATTSRAGLIAEAEGGTLFLDEVGELPLELQPKLLRALETGEIRPVGATQYRRVDVRVVAATHRRLRTLVENGVFREDLFYRLAVVEAEVPPLRDRRDDIPLLVANFLEAREPKASLSDLPPGTLSMLQTHAWPGNVRELRNAVARVMVVGQAMEALGVAPRTATPGGSQLLHLSLREARALVVADFERAYLSGQLKAHGSTPAAAKAMGVSRQLVHRMLQEYGLGPRDD